MVTGASDGSRLWNTSTGEELAQLLRIGESDWVVLTPEGYYAASREGHKYLSWRIGSNIYPNEPRFRERYHRPAVVRAILSSEKGAR